MPGHHATPLKFLMPGWFAMVMGLCGLALAWARAVPLMGEMAGAAALIIGGFAALVFAALLLGSLVRLQRYPKALEEDLKHPVRHAFVATLPVSVILLGTVLFAVAGVSWPARLLWALGSAAQFGVTLWVLARWLKGNCEGGLVWAGITPVLLIPVVGNVVPALAGAPLGFGDWAAAQFGVGLFFWPVVMALLAVRVGIQGLWADRLLPSTFITIAPPAVIGVGIVQMGAPAPLLWMCWGAALFFLLWSTSIFKRMVAQPFAITFWGLSFPLASFAALTLRLAEGSSGAFGALAMVTLALASLVIAWLVLGTVKGLREGSLLAPEPVASITPVAAAPGA